MAPAAILVGTLAGVARQTGAGALDTVWAEDGTTFLAQALDLPFAQTILTPYAGYLHLVPRLLTELVAAIPLAYAAIGFAVLGALGAAVLAAVVYHATAGHYRSTAIRAVLAASLVFLPVARGEVLANVVNLHWLLVPAAFWVLLSRPRGGAAVGVGTAVAALAGLSDPFAVLLIPIAAARLLVLRDWRDHLVTAGWAVGVLGQVLVVVVADAPQRAFAPRLDPLYLGGWYGTHVVTGAAFGDQLPISPFALLPVAAVIAAGLAVVALRARHDGRSWAFPVVAIGMSVVCYLVPVGLTGFTAPRYALMPVMLLMAAAAWVIDTPRTRRLRIAAAVLVAVVWTTGFFVAGPRAAGPRWSTELAAAEARCETDGGDVTVPISPRGWEFDVPCAEVG